jgi:hypothetical protein
VLSRGEWPAAQLVGDDGFVGYGRVEWPDTSLVLLETSVAILGALWRWYILSQARRAIRPRWPRIVRKVFILEYPNILASNVVGYSAMVPPRKSSWPIISAIPRNPGSTMRNSSTVFRRYTRKQLV